VCSASVWEAAVFVAQRVRIGGQRTIIGVGIGGQRTINGVRNDCGGAARSAGFCGVSGRAGRHRQRGGGKCMTTWGDSGQPLPRYEPWWRHESPLPALVAPRIPTTTLGGTSQHHHAPWWHHESQLSALMAPRIPFTARIGVGAAQNRRQYHRVVSTVGGDAGRPAHQRPETPRCATHHHDRFAPVCGPTARRFPPRYPPTSRNTPLRAAPRCVDSHPSAAPSRADSHPHQHPKPRAARRPAMHRFAPFAPGHSLSGFRSNVWHGTTPRFPLDEPPLTARCAVPDVLPRRSGWAGGRWCTMGS
jgi:hypothetical protein